LESTVLRSIEIQSYDACLTVARKVCFRSSRTLSALHQIYPPEKSAAPLSVADVRASIAPFAAF
jgi:hypothetical protein